LHDVESLLIAVSKPEGNKNRGKLKGDLKKALKDSMKAAAIEEINASLFPNQEPKQTKKGHRITEKKIEAFIKAKGVVKTASILGVFSRTDKASFGVISDYGDGLLPQVREKSS